MFNSISYKAYLNFVSKNSCHIEDQLKNLYVCWCQYGLHFIRSVVFMSRALLDEFALFNYNSCTARVMLRRAISTTVERNLHIRISQNFFKTQLVGYRVRNGMEFVWLWREYCVSAGYDIFCVVIVCELQMWTPKMCVRKKYDRMKFWFHLSTHFCLLISWMDLWSNFS
jgi:hypothetical protein